MPTAIRVVVALITVTLGGNGGNYRMAERPEHNGIIIYWFKLEDRADIIRELNYVGLRYIDYGVQTC